MGLMGSFHCVGMCGPIVLAMGRRPGQSSAQFFTGKLLYNLGRTLTYSFMGLLVGLFGEMLQFSAWQQSLSIGVGVLLLLSVLVFPNWERHLLRIPLLKQGLVQLRMRLSALLRQQGVGGQFQIGLLNGFLPCGFVYMGLAGALVSGHWAYSTAYMALFGLGTIPGMMLLSWLGNRWQHKLSFQKPAVIRLFVALFACLFILRGLGLGIPFLSPAL